MSDSPSSQPPFKLKGLTRYRSFIKGAVVLIGSSIILILVLELLVWLGFRDQVQRINEESRTGLASWRIIDWWNCAGQFEVCAAGFIWSNSSPVAIAIRAFELLCSAVFLVWLVCTIPIGNRFRNYVFSAYAIWIVFVIVLFLADYIGRVFHIDSIDALGGLGLVQAAAFGVALISFLIWLFYQSRTVLTLGLIGVALVAWNSHAHLSKDDNVLHLDPNPLEILGWLTLWWPFINWIVRAALVFMVALLVGLALAAITTVFSFPVLLATYVASEVLSQVLPEKTVLLPVILSSWGTLLFQSAGKVTELKLHEELGTVLDKIAREMDLMRLAAISGGSKSRRH